VTLRLANIYGPGQPANFLIPQVIAQILDDRIPEIEVQDLAPKRDYIYVDDAIEGMILSMRASPGSIFNLGTGVAYSVEEIIKSACAVAGIHKPYRAIGKARTNEIEESLLDAASIRETAGWEPKISIERGLQFVFESMRRCEV